MSLLSHSGHSFAPCGEEGRPPSSGGSWKDTVLTRDAHEGTREASLGTGGPGVNCWKGEDRCTSKPAPGPSACVGPGPARFNLHGVLWGPRTVCIWSSGPGAERTFAIAKSSLAPEDLHPCFMISRRIGRVWNRREDACRRRPHSPSPRPGLRPPRPCPHPRWPLPVRSTCRPPSPPLSPLIRHVPRRSPLSPPVSSLPP